MYCTRQIAKDLYWVGASDRRLALFENLYPIPRGVSYNSYLLLDEKTVLFDTVDRSVSTQFIENIAHILNGRALDYLIINHVEPDHCASIGDLLTRYENLQLVCNTKSCGMLKQFFDFDIEKRVFIVKEGDTLCTGDHSFTFVMAPMVHWPEVMVTYDIGEKILFSADAFGTFGALNGNIFADEMDFEKEWLGDARRYYTNIVGKYGAQVSALLKKASTLEINMICPLHGPIWRENIGYIVDKYQKWASYTPEDDAVLIVYGSIHGNTENTANALACLLADAGIKNISMHDVSVTHISELVSEAFRCSHIVFASITYNAGIFSKMETLLMDLKAHNLQNRTVAIIENGSWAATAGKLIKGILDSMKNINIIGDTLTLQSSLKENQLEELSNLASAIAESLKNKK